MSSFYRATVRAVYGGYDVMQVMCFCWSVCDSSKSRLRDPSETLVNNTRTPGHRFQPHMLHRLFLGYCVSLGLQKCIPPHTPY